MGRRHGCLGREGAGSGKPRPPSQLVRRLEAERPRIGLDRARPLAGAFLELAKRQPAGGPVRRLLHGLPHQLDRRADLARLLVEKRIGMAAVDKRIARAA
jgi:hypothetical protein